MDGEVSLLGSFCELLGNRAQCHEESNVNTTCIAENFANDLMDVGDTVLVKMW